MYSVQSQTALMQSSSQLSPVLRARFGHPPWLHVSGTNVRSTGPKNWIFLGCVLIRGPAGLLATSFITRHCHYPRFKEEKRKEKRKEGEKGRNGKGATMPGISQSAHRSWRIYLQPKNKELLERRQEKQKKKKRNYQNASNKSPFALSFPFLLSVSRPRSSSHYGL